MDPPRVVLFDIDETLVHTGGSGARSWRQAFDELYGEPADIGAHTSAGETDPQVAQATFRAVLGREPEVDELGRLYARYLMYLAEDIWHSEGYRVLPGAESTLEALGRQGITLGLVSGAMEGAARTKLLPAGLNKYFIFGAYGSDSPDRHEVVRLAIEKATRLHELVGAAEVFVVGDTPLDVEAAHAAGATAVGVASGHFSVEELARSNPEFTLASLDEPFPGTDAPAAG